MINCLKIPSVPLDSTIWVESKPKCIYLERERENRCLVEIQQSAPSPVCNMFSNLH